MLRIVSDELVRKNKIMKLPKYDYHTDTFMDLPKNFDVDRHFKNTEQLTKNNELK